MAIRNVDQTTEQVNEWLNLHKQVADLLGKKVAEGIATTALDWGDEGNHDMSEVYDFAIRMANDRLGHIPPVVLDDTEYHEIIQAQEIMDKL